LLFFLEFEVELDIESGIELIEVVYESIIGEFDLVLTVLTGV
jgi:hypothetical protein